MHGPDTGTWGARHYEVYDNEFVFSNPGDGTHAYGIDGWFIPRGGTGVFTGNIVPDINSGSWSDKSEVILQIQMLTRPAGPNPQWGSNNDVPISSASVASSTVVETSSPHGLATGDFVRITGSNSTPSIDGYRQVTRLTDMTYTFSGIFVVNVTVAATAGKSNRVDYPCPRQIGLGYITGEGLDGLGRSEDPNPAVDWPGGYVGDSEPLYIWGNTGTWAGGIGIVASSDPVTDPDLAADYIIAGRDYVANGTPKPGWTRFEYPHPLRGEEPPSGGGSSIPTLRSARAPRYAIPRD
jgi:hypothetical protein